MTDFALTEHALIVTDANSYAGEPISSHAKGYEAVVHFGQSHNKSFASI
jgi:hypothetical protein